MDGDEWTVYHFNEWMDTLMDWMSFQNGCMDGLIDWIIFQNFDGWLYVLDTISKPDNEKLPSAP